MKAQQKTTGHRGNVVVIGGKKKLRSTDSKSLLLVDLDKNHGDITHSLEASGWDVDYVDNFREAANALEHTRSDVGVVLVPDRLSEVVYDALETILVQDDMAWIALVPEPHVQDKRLLQIISRTCFDYHKLPVDLDRLKVFVGHAAGMMQLRKHVPQKRTDEYVPCSLQGSSPQIQMVMEKIQKFARVDAPVLVRGESGTGKELAARMIHQQSSRAHKPIEVINCAALPASLIQSELFGHEKGSFTGAHARKIGSFEVADGGTVFLDEIGDLAMDLQVILLRVLEQKIVRRVGGTQDIPIDVRIVAATHVDLKQAVKKGHFREDLFYRLNVLTVDLPPLRDRPADVELLANHYLKEFGRTLETEPKGFNQQAIKAMRSYDWPGNVRQLINHVQQAAVLADGNLISVADLGLERRRRPRSKGGMSLEEARALAEKHAVVAALRDSDNNISEAAKTLGVSRMTVYRLVEKYEIET